MLVAAAADVVDPSATVPPNIVAAEKSRAVVVIIRRRTRGFQMRRGSVRITRIIYALRERKERLSRPSKGRLVCKLMSILTFEAAGRKESGRKRCQRSFVR